MAREILEISGRQTFRRQDLLHKNIQRYALAVDSQCARQPRRMKHRIRRRRRLVVADVNADLIGLLEEQQADVNFAFHAVGGELRVFFRPDAVVEKIKKLHFMLRVEVIVLRDFFSVNRAEVGAAAAVAVAHALAGRKIKDK